MRARYPCIEVSVNEARSTKFVPQCCHIKGFVFFAYPSLSGKSRPDELCIQLWILFWRLLFLNNLNVTTFSYHLPKKWDHLTRWCCSYDFKHKLRCETNFTTYCNCFVCGQSITQQKITKMIMRLSLHLKAYLENYFMKIIPVFCWW